MNKLKVSFGITIMVVISMLMLTSCDPKYDTTGLPIKGVAYNETTNDVWYYGENEHIEKKIYLIMVDIDTNLLSSGLKNSDANWKAICSAENNEVLWGGGYSYGSYGANQDILIRLKNPYDPTTDAGKRIFFDTNNVFTVEGGSGNIFYSSPDTKAFISTSEKVIDFSVYKEWKEKGWN